MTVADDVRHAKARNYRLLRPEKFAGAAQFEIEFRDLEAVEAEPFDSIGLNYLLHCLPGPMTAKAVAFDNLSPLLRPGGTIFGGTVLRHGIRLPLQARGLMSMYNAMGIFGNSRDSLDGLRSELESRFDDVAIETHGCVALFRACARASDEAAPSQPSVI